ncbi:hypothetical protein L916_11921 [Phytophthora nicotianae]|nr:hypothetical protein L916_11921 [Phytophthora nicotianae]
MELPYSADTGAERTAINQEHVKQLMLRDPTVKFTLLTTPMTLGIDINRQLEQLAERERDDDACLSDNDSAPISTSALTDVNLKEAVEQLVQKALEHGFPKNLSNSSAPLL